MCSQDKIDIRTQFAKPQLSLGGGGAVYALRWGNKLMLWIKVILENPVVVQLDKKFSTF
jgi:hypothetical protein